MSRLLSRIADDARVYPHQLDVLSDAVLLVQLSDDDLGDHSFLDQRVLRQDMTYEWLPWAELESAAASLPQNAPRYIFHIGHCGSTLLSRLVAEASDTDALREPLPLRTFAIDHAEGTAGLIGSETIHSRLGMLERLWSRRADTTVKATSICSNLLDVVNESAPLVFVHQKAETHLAVVLAGDNALQDLRGFGQNRYRRLLGFDNNLPPLAGMSIGELAAMTWLAELSSASKCLERRDALLLDFDDFLATPAPQLEAACKYLGLETTPGQCEAVVAGPIMQRYSKAPEHDYGPQLRADVIADSRRRNSAEILKGLALVERFRSTTCGEDWR